MKLKYRMEIPTLAVLTLLAAFAGQCFLIKNAAGQSVRYSFIARNAPLDLALKRFAEETGINVTYLSETTAHHHVYCVIESALPDEILKCLLEDTDLDYIRLSTGTYAIVESPQKEAQYTNVNGQVVSAVTQTPVGFAHVFIRDLDYGTITDDAGRFVFPPLLPGSYQLTASHLGYKVWHDTIDVAPVAAFSISIPLSPVTYSFEPIVIDAQSTAHISNALLYEEVDAALLLEQAPSFGAINTLQHLSVNRGIQFSQTTSDIHIQGGTAGEHRVRLDGAPIFLPQQLGGFWGPFNPQAIEQIQIHKSGFGASLGSFQSGVMEISHRLNAPQGENIAIHIAPLTFNALASAQHRMNSSRLNLMAAFRTDLWSLYAPRSTKRGLKSWSALDTFPVEAPLFLGGSLSAGDEPIYETLASAVAPALSFEDYHGAANVQLSPTRRIYASFYRGNLGVSNEVETTSLGITDRYKWYNATGQIKFETMLGSRALAAVQWRSSKFKLNHNYRLLDRLNVFADRALFESQVLVERPVEDRNRIAESAVAVDVSYAQSSRHHLQVGAELNFTQSQINMVASHTLSLVDKILRDRADSLDARMRWFEGNVKTTRAALYFEDTWRLGTALIVQPGIRWTSDGIASFMEPRLALSLTGTPTPVLTWGGRFATGIYHQFITQYDLSTANLGAVLPSLRIWFPVQGELPPRSAHFSINAFLEHTNGWMLRLESFLKLQPHTLVLKQLPSETYFSVPNRFEPFTSFLEPARGSAAGLAVTVKKEMKQFGLTMTTEWTRARRRSASYFDNRYVMPSWAHPFRLVASLHWQPIKAFTVRVNWQGSWRRSWAFRQVYYDNLAHGENAGAFPPYDLSSPEGHRLPPHQQLDFNIGFGKAGLFPIKIDAGILNVFDRKNIADWRLKFNTTSGRFDRESRISLPRFSPYVRLSVSW